MNAHNFLILYLELNASLAIAYAMSKILKASLKNSNLISFLQLKRIVLSIFLVSLVSTPVSHLIPSSVTQQLVTPLFGNPKSFKDVDVGERHGNLKYSAIPALERKFEPQLTTPWYEQASADAIERYTLFALFIGFIFSVTIKTRGVFQLRRLLKHSRSFKRFGRVFIGLSAHTSIPFSALTPGRAYVVLPQNFLQVGVDLKIAIAHEIQHHREKDTFWILVFESFVTLFFANPFAYAWRGLFIELQELSCDEILIGRQKVSPRAYGECLLRVAEAALRSRHVHVGTTCSMMETPNGHFKSLLGRRIQMFHRHQVLRSKKRFAIGIGTLLCLSSVGLAMEGKHPLKIQETPATQNATGYPEIEKLAERELLSAIKSSHARSGFVIVADPNNGRILADVALDNNAKRDSAVSRLVEPSSVMKGVVAAKAIDSRTTNAEEMHNCENGKYEIGGFTLHDWKAFKKLSTADSLIHSSSICTYKLVQEMGSEKLMPALENFGFGEKGVASSFPGANVVSLPRFEHAPAYVAVGYGFVVNPLDLVQAYGAIANGGNLMKPQPYSQQDNSGIVLRRVLSQETSRQMRGILARVVSEGTGQHAKSNLYTTAGKTGSGTNSEVYEHLMVTKNANTASFIGFAPADTPKVEVYVFLSAATNVNLAGGRNAAPAFKSIAEGSLQLLHAPVSR